jgi:molybdopterin-guanine dinucleotide biosynthesis protein A
MGRDKARLVLDRKSFVSRIRSTASEIGVPVRIIRKDLVERCGPLGGIYTGITTTKAEAVLFLACDMPFVTPPFLEKLIHRFETSAKTSAALFTNETDRPGFPFILSTATIGTIERQIESKVFSLHALAKALKAKVYRATARETAGLFNINTPEEFAEAARRLTASADASGTSRKAQGSYTSRSRRRVLPPGRACS